MTDHSQPRFRSPRVLIPFLIVTIIWGSTWIVIKDQLGVVPASWSVTYRFLTAGIVMLGVAIVTRAPLNIGRGGFIFAGLMGTAQFVLNFNFVYRAEHYVASGLVAVVFSLLFVPNAIMGQLFLGQRMSGRFIFGSVIAVSGISLLFVHEAQTGSSGQMATLAGIGFTLLGVMSASTANVMQATEHARRLPMASMLGWGMLMGAAIDATFAWISAGPPVIDMRWGYFVGVGYLGVIASAIAFSLYFRIIRDIGPARAAYSSVLIPVIAMGFSTVFENYKWSVLAALGSALALSGMVVALSVRKPST
jgi:drug/metabolite transporter (DMT)-like permease